MAQIGVDIGSFTFVKATGVITFTGVTFDSISQFTVIVDGGALNSAPTDLLNAGKGDERKGVLSVGGTVLTLDYDTSTADYLDDPTGKRLIICANLPDEAGENLTAYKDDGVNTNVSIDAVLPANNKPLPISLYNLLGVMGVNTNPLGVSLFDTSTAARAIVDKNGALKVGEAIIMAGDVFGGVSPSSFFWEFAGTGANVTQAGNERIETGVGANGSRQFQTEKKARFMGSQFNVFHGGINLPDLANADVFFRFGPVNTIGTRNGSYFEAEGGVSPTWNLCTVKNGVITKVPQANWTGKGKDNFNAMPGLAVYEVIYNAGSVAFFQGPNLLHTQTVSALGETYANQYHFNVGFEAENVNGNTTNNGIELYAGVIYRLGEERGELISRAFEGTQNTLIKTGAGYVEHAYLSRTGSGGGAAFVKIYDGIDNTGKLMKRIDVGADDYKGGAIKSTYSVGLYIEQDGTGTLTSDLSLE